MTASRVLVVSFHVVPSACRQGVQVRHVLKALASRFTVDALSVRAGDLGYVERMGRVRMHRVPVQGQLPAQIEAFRRAVRRQLESGEYDVVHIRDGRGGLPVVERKAQLGYKVVFEVGHPVAGGDLDVRARADLLRDEERCFAQSDIVIVPTERGRKALAARGRTEDVLLAPPGVDIDLFDWDVADAPAPPCIVYAGAIAAGRGIRLLLQAMRLVVYRAPARLVLVGPLDEAFAGPLGHSIRQLGIQDHVEIVGPIANDEVPRLLSRSTVCVAPAVDEDLDDPGASYPTKLLEYLGCCRATVAPATPLVTDVIEDGRTGLLFTPWDATDLAEKIQILLVDAALRSRLAAEGHAHVRGRFPASATRRQLMAAYASLLPTAIWGTPGERVAGIISSPSAEGPRSTDTDHGSDGPGETQASATLPPSGEETRGTSPGSPILHPDPESSLVTPSAARVESWAVAPAAGLIAEISDVDTGEGISLPDAGEAVGADTGVGAVADDSDPPFVAAGKLLGPEER